MAQQIPRQHRAGGPPGGVAEFWLRGHHEAGDRATELAAARVDADLRMPDACVIATARSTGSDTVLTFDPVLARAATGLGLSAGTA